MTVRNPTFVACPSCGNRTFDGTQVVRTQVDLDHNDHVSRVGTDEFLDRWLTLQCEGCGKVLIEDGAWVIDPDTGDTVDVDPGAHQTLDSFDASTVGES